MHIHYAIGDVHGRDDLLEALLARIAATHKWRHPDIPATLVYLGDYIDRGLRSREVIDRVRKGLPEFATIALKGNHEDLMLACLTTTDLDVWGMWLGNGGEQTAASFGLAVDTPDDCDPIALAKALGGERLRWFDTLKLYHRTDEYLFVHAGILPGRPLAQQHEKDLLWIRNAFLHSDVDHGCIVVHGHTPTEHPELKANRIGVDTGPTLYGNLTAVVLGEAEGPRFITISGEAGAGPPSNRLTSPE